MAINPKRSFSFTWILENFEYCWHKKGKLLKSPTFIVDTIERSKWSLSIYPRGKESENWISVFLCREEDSKGPVSIEVDYEIAFLASDGSILKSFNMQNHAFSKNHSWGLTRFQERESAIANRSRFLPQDALTIRCRIWKSIGEIWKDEQCIARTRIGVERKTFVWKIKNFSSFDFGREKKFKLKSTSDDKPIVSIGLSLTLCELCVSPHILLEFVLSNKSIIFSTFKSKIADAKGDYVECSENGSEIWFSPANTTHSMILSISRDKLMDNKHLYLPNDVLTLYCEQVFSPGIVLNGIEATSYGCSASFITNNVVSEKIKTTNTKESNFETPDLKLDVSSMLHENILCDVKLCVKSETFPAHWFILIARSPVFRAMFKSGMKEKAKQRIVIEDMKPDTVRRMLLYMYTDSFGDIEWKTASDLYIAAEKYQMMILKDKCSSFLKTNLSLTNACEILLLADLHQDMELKSTVQNFILENDKSIINSSEWKLFMQSNVHLAAETMVLRFKE